MSLRKCLLAICVLLAVVPVMAQERPHVKVETAAARAADVSTIDGVIKAFYEVISGPAGQARQWSRDRTLYIPDVRFVPVERGRDGKVHAQPITHQQFVDSADAGLV